MSEWCHPDVRLMLDWCNMMEYFYNTDIILMKFALIHQHDIILMWVWHQPNISLTSGWHHYDISWTFSPADLFLRFCFTMFYYEDTYWSWICCDHCYLVFFLRYQVHWECSWWYSWVTVDMSIRNPHFHHIAVTREKFSFQKKWDTAFVKTKVSTLLQKLKLELRTVECLCLSKFCITTGIGKDI